ncbi:SMP-30/gluconolactonase/LRE family protein [Stieleria sp. TO1_6]|uniref:SMP-30/gluconolactonase/LRE family protein n=1 Tax=Stieleria tagensis TaxID=2956795 RepID=UPI00209B31B8|nr:SMP-30/gluconolactonase/LRE family protein [Stieleria tagensis]MCO8123631.1 SMP-30/gluconolactonase/LRE family protein [Stieleria tagensis]
MANVIEATPLSVPDSDALRFLPEGPYQIAPGQFSWVGIQHGSDANHGSLNRYDFQTGQNISIDLPGRPGFAFPCSPNAGAALDRFVVGCERSLGFVDLESKQFTPFCEGVDGDVTGTIINDGLVIDDNLIFGTKDLEFATKKAGLYLYRGRDQKLIRLRDDQICSNGKATLSQDGQLWLVDIDSPTRQVVRYQLDIDGGSLGPAEVVLDLTADPAVPDGAILTPDGSGLIVSMFLPQAAAYGETRLYDLTTGQCQTIWRTPLSPQNTCPALVAENGTLKLVITTAVENMTADDQAVCTNAGRIFVADSGLAVGSWNPPQYRG